MSECETGDASVRTTSRSLGFRSIRLILIALLFDESRKVPLEGEVESSSRSKARMISSPSISAVSILSGSDDRVVWFSTLSLEKEARSLPAISWMTFVFWLPFRSL